MIRVHKKRDGLLAVREDGSGRFLTWLEAIRYSFTGKLPREFDKEPTHAPE